MLKKATGCTNDDWSELFNQKLGDRCPTRECSESQQAIAPRPQTLTTPNQAAPAAPKAPTAPATPPSSSTPTTPKNPAAMQQGGSSSSSDATTEHLEKIAASDLAARASASSAVVSSASSAASSTRIGNNFDVARETMSEVLQLKQRLFHYARPKDRNIGIDEIRGRSDNRAREERDRRRDCSRSQITDLLRR